jgi:hypothetical protein
MASGVSQFLNVVFGKFGLGNHIDCSQTMLVTLTGCNCKAIFSLSCGSTSLYGKNLQIIFSIENIEKHMMQWQSHDL